MEAELAARAAKLAGKQGEGFSNRPLSAQDSCLVAWMDQLAPFRLFEGDGGLLSCEACFPPNDDVGRVVQALKDHVAGKSQGGSGCNEGEASGGQATKAQ